MATCSSTPPSLGGSGGNYCKGIAVDSWGNAYVTGFTRSSDFPSKNPHQDTLGGNTDTFVTGLWQNGAVRLIAHPPAALITEPKNSENLTGTVDVIKSTVHYGTVAKTLGTLTLADKPDESFEVKLTYTSPTGESKTQYVKVDEDGRYESTFESLYELGTWEVTVSFDDKSYQHAEGTKTFNVIKGISEIEWLNPPQTVKLGATAKLTGKLSAIAGVPARELNEQEIKLRLQKPDEAETDLPDVETDSYSLFSINELLFDKPGDWRFTAIWEGNDFYSDANQSLIITVTKEVGKAIVVHAGGDEEDNPEWEKFSRTANYVYESLIKRRFTADDIWYLSPSQKPNPMIVDAETNKLNLQKAILWAKELVNKHIPLYIYLLSHNTGDNFLLEKHGHSEVYLKPAELDNWLDDISLDVPITVIIEACYSGNFIDDLAGENRTIITSADNDRQAQIMKSSSFSRALFGDGRIIGGFLAKPNG